MSSVTTSVLGLTGAAATGTLRAVMYTAEAQRGHARYTRDLLNAVAQAGAARNVAVELVTGQDIAPEFRSPHYPIQAILPPLLGRHHYRNTPEWAAARVSHYVKREQTFLNWAAARSDLDLVHFQEYTPWLAPLHYPRLRRRGMEVVATVHNIANFGHSSRMYMRTTQQCWRIAWRRCSGLIVHTNGLRARLSEFLGSGHPPIFVTEHAIWEERTSPPLPVEPPRPGEPARLLFFGVIRPNKGLTVLLKALRQLPECRLTIVGEPERPCYLDEVQALIASLPSGQVDLTPHYIPENEIAGVFDRAQLLILPYTEFASQSGVLHQAVAHGRPVVATSEGGLGESVREWRIGEVVAARDESALAAGIRRALEPKTFRAAADATARWRLEHTWTRMAEATLDVYRILAG